MFRVSSEPTRFAIQVRPTREFLAESAVRTRARETGLPAQEIKRRRPDRGRTLMPPLISDSELKDPKPNAYALAQT
jgi:hypothetical protein